MSQQCKYMCRLHACRNPCRTMKCACFQVVTRSWPSTPRIVQAYQSDLYLPGLTAFCLLTAVSVWVQCFLSLWLEFRPGAVDSLSTGILRRITVKVRKRVFILALCNAIHSFPQSLALLISSPLFVRSSSNQSCLSSVKCSLIKSSQLLLKQCFSVHLLSSTNPFTHVCGVS